MTGSPQEHQLFSSTGGRRWSPHRQAMLRWGTVPASQPKPLVRQPMLMAPEPIADPICESCGRALEFRTLREGHCSHCAQAPAEGRAQHQAMQRWYRIRRQRMALAVATALSGACVLVAVLPKSAEDQSTAVLPDPQPVEAPGHWRDAWAEFRRDDRQRWHELPVTVSVAKASCHELSPAWLREGQTGRLFWMEAEQGAEKWLGRFTGDRAEEMVALLSHVSQVPLTLRLRHADGPAGLVEIGQLVRRGWENDGNEIRPFAARSSLAFVGADAWLGDLSFGEVAEVH